MTFPANGKVKIRRIMELFGKVSDESNLNILEENNAILNPWLDTISEFYNNTIEISNILELEKERNLKNKSKVEAIYYP